MVEYMIIISGIWVAILPYMKWSDIGKKLSVFHLLSGVYTSISIIVYMINDEIFSYRWVQAAYIIICILLVMEIIAKIEGKRVVFDVLAIVTSILGLMLSVVVFFIDSGEISSSIIMVVGLLIIISVPFYRIGVEFAKKEK